MSCIYIVTAHTGYNYGTYLQAFAMKKFLKEYADTVEIIWQKSFGPTGRDFRLNKIIALGVRTILDYRKATVIKQGYAKTFAAEPSEKTKRLFDLFSADYLHIQEYRYNELKKKAANLDTLAVVCGSDQIWNASSMYPDPLYYLQFVPKQKRIAYAPSFGRSEIPSYNKLTIQRYLNSIPSISVREYAGASIVKQLTGRDVPVVPDPTLIVDWGDWFAKKKEEYMVLYFLDQPTDKVIQDINNIQRVTGFKIKVLLHFFNKYNYLKNIELVEAGPKEFVEVISKSRFVCTDSFHASIFSMMSETPFYTYERNYGKVDNQESRLETLMKHYKMENRYRRNSGDFSTISIDCDMNSVRQIRSKDITYSRKYIKWALDRIKEGENFDS